METATEKEVLNKAQVELMKNLGYNPAVVHYDSLYEARRDAKAIIAKASTPSDAMTATFTLYNTIVHALAKAGVPLGEKHVSKGDLVALLYGGDDEYTIDFARPYTWDQAVVPLGIDPHDYVWCYSKGDGKFRHGGPLHLGQEVLNRLLKAEL